MDGGTRVGMVDSRQGFVEALCRCLWDTPDLVVAWTSSSLELAVRSRLLGQCDVLLLGFDEGVLMSRLDDVLTAHPQLGVVLIAESDDESKLLDAIASGVMGWVTRHDGVDDLLTALREVGRGGAHYPTEAVQALLVSRLDDRGRAAALATRQLTRREEDVLSCLAAGMSRQEVGAALELSDNTVRTYVRRILRKLHVRSAAAAVAMHQGWETSRG